MGLWADGSVSMSLQPQPAGRSQSPRAGGPGAVGSPGRVRAPARTRSGTDEPDEEAGLADAVVRAQKGDSEAFRLLYRDLQPRLLRYLATLAGPLDAEDIPSETWLQVTRDLAGLP